MMKKKLLWMLLPITLAVCLGVIEVGRASPATAVAVVPSEVKDLEPDASFTVSITVADVVISETPPLCKGLYGWSVKLTFEPDILDCTGVEEGSFLEDAFETSFFPPNINNTVGFVYIGAMFDPSGGIPAQGAAGSGVLATVTFKVKGMGETPLRLESPKLRTVIAGTLNVPEIWETESLLITDGVFRNVAPAILSPELIAAVIAIVAIGGGVAVFLYRKRRD